MTDDLRLSEYGALRQTIRHRGSVRMWLTWAGLVAWATLAMVLAASEFDRALTLVPLLVLVFTFEIGFFIHTGIERVGRYLQVYYEDLQWGWENAVMSYGKNFAGGGLDPLFVPLFVIAVAVNFPSSLPAAARHPGWIGISVVAHSSFLWRIVVTRRHARRQRALDLERFQTLKNRASSN